MLLCALVTYTWQTYTKIRFAERCYTYGHRHLNSRWLCNVQATVLKESANQSERPADASATSDSAAAERSLLALITDIQNGLARSFRERTSHLGLSRAQWRVLSAISGRPGLTQTELAEMVGVGRAPAGKIVDRLQAKGWVERRNDAADRRINRLHITRDFRPIAEPTRTISDAIINELLADVEATDREVFNRVLRHIHGKLGFASEQGPDAAAADTQT